MDLLGLHWRDYVIDFSYPFGFKHGSSICQQISDGVRFIMKKDGHQIRNYIDDFLCPPPSKIGKTYSRMQQLLGELAVAVGPKKLVLPSTKVVCHGILVDTVNCTFSITPDELESFF